LKKTPPCQKIWVEAEQSKSCGPALNLWMRDNCLEPGKNEALKMLDLQTKSTIELI